MKPPPGPLFIFGPTDRPRRARPLPTTAVHRPAPHRTARTAAIGLAVTLVLGGAAVLAPYAGRPGPSPTTTTSVVP